MLLFYAGDFERTDLTVQIEFSEMMDFVTGIKRLDGPPKIFRPSLPQLNGIRMVHRFLGNFEILVPVDSHLGKRPNFEAIDQNADHCC